MAAGMGACFSRMCACDGDVCGNTSEWCVRAGSTCGRSIRAWGEMYMMQCALGGRWRVCWQRLGPPQLHQYCCPHALWRLAGLVNVSTCTPPSVRSAGHTRSMRVQVNPNGNVRDPSARWGTYEWSAIRWHWGCLMTVDVFVCGRAMQAMCEVE
jgi:hypothetical protein